MELIYVDKDIVVCIKPARVLSTEGVCWEVVSVSPSPEG